MAEKFLNKEGLIEYEKEQKKRYNTLNGQIGTKADSSKVSELESRLASDETGMLNSFANIEGRVGSLEAGITNKVDKVSGKDLISTTDINQIATNKANIESLSSTKVDKVTGKDLISTTDINQISANKTNIENLTTSVNNKAESSVVNSLNEKVTGIDGTVSNLGSRLYTVEVTLPSKADTTYVQGIEGSVSSHNATLTNHESRIGSLESQMTTVSGQIGNIQTRLANIV